MPQPDDDGVDDVAHGDGRRGDVGRGVAHGGGHPTSVGIAGGSDQDRPAPGLAHGPKVETGGRQEHGPRGRARPEDEGDVPRVGGGRQDRGGDGNEQAGEGGNGTTAQAGHPGNLDARQATLPC
jgi:hypothetical protein